MPKARRTRKVECSSINFMEEYYKFCAEHRIEKRKKRPNDVESHHLHPKSLGGTDDEKNIVRLSRKDHAYAHLFLALALVQLEDRLSLAASKLGRAAEIELLESVDFAMFKSFRIVLQSPETHECIAMSVRNAAKFMMMHNPKNFWPSNKEQIRTYMLYAIKHALLMLSSYGYKWTMTMKRR